MVAVDPGRDRRCTSGQPRALSRSDLPRGKSASLRHGDVAGVSIMWRRRPCSTPTWSPSTSTTPLGHVSPRMGPGHATRAHPPNCVGVPARLWPNVVPVDVRVPPQLRPAEREPAKGLVGTGCPSVHLTAGPTHPIGVDPLARCRDRVPHPPTLHDRPLTSPGHQCRCCVHVRWHSVAHE